MKPETALDTPRAIAAEDYPETTRLLEAAQSVLKRQAVMAAWPVVIALIRRVVRLTIGNAFLDQQYWLVKMENRDLKRLLNTLIAQNGGRVELQEAVWKRMKADKLVLGQITPSGDTALVLTNEAPLTRRAGLPSFFDDDGAEGDLVLTNRGLAELGVEETIYSPVFDVTRLRSTESGRIQAGGLLDPTAPLAQNPSTSGTVA